MWALPTGLGTLACLNECGPRLCQMSGRGQLRGVGWAWVFSMGVGSKRQRGPMCSCVLSLYICPCMLDVVSWITGDLAPRQSGSATEMHRHMVSANSTWAQAPKHLPGSEIQELESSPHQLIGTGGYEKRDLLFLSKCITCLFHWLSVNYSCGSGFHEIILMQEGKTERRKKKKKMPKKLERG